MKPRHTHQQHHKAMTSLDALHFLCPTRLYHFSDTCVGFLVDPTYDDFLAHLKRLHVIAYNTIFDLHKLHEDTFEDQVRLSHESQVVEAEKATLAAREAKEASLKQPEEEAALKKAKLDATIVKMNQVFGCLRHTR